MSPDFRELLSTFNAHDVDYIVVGAHALAAHGHVRATKDLDVWVKPSHENAAKVLRALAEFGRYRYRSLHKRVAYFGPTTLGGP